MALKKWTRSKEGIWRYHQKGDTYSYSMWAGTNNNIYLVVGKFKEIIYYGKSEKDANLKLKKALTMIPGDILFYGVD